MSRLLQDRVTERLMFGYANKTWLAYQRIFKLFMAFCFFIGKNFSDNEYKTVLLYIEFLVYNGLKHASIVNHISAIRSYGKWLDLDMSHLNHFKVTLMLKAVANSVKHQPKFKGIFDVNQCSFYYAFPRLLSLYWGEKTRTRYGPESR